MIKTLLISLLFFFGPLSATPHLILHFDVNKTLIASDLVKDETAEDIIWQLTGNRADFKRVVDRLGGNFVFPSFFKLIEKLDGEGISYTVHLRTFGLDRDAVVDEIHSKLGRQLFEKATFVGKELKVGCEGVESPYDLFRYHNMAIQDDWTTWMQSGRQDSCGKPFPINVEDEEVITLFFDDNSAIAPEHAVSRVAVDLDGRYIPVDTLSAIEDENYFINLLKNHDLFSKIL